MNPIPVPDEAKKAGAAEHDAQCESEFIIEAGASMPCRCGERTCHVCGCTQDDCSNCIERTGRPCSWVAGDLCSACA